MSVTCECGLVLSSSRQAQRASAWCLVALGLPPHLEIHRETGGCFPLKRHGTRSKPAAKENVCGRNLSVWWVCFRKTDFAFDAISYWEREEKRENRCFLLFLNSKENFALFYVCVYPRAAFPAPLLLLSHTVVVAAVACCPSGPCALLYCCRF